MQEFLPLVIVAGVADAVPASAAAVDLSTWGLIANAGLVVKAVMGVLAFMSIMSWYIIGYKFLYFRRAISESQRFIDSFWRSKDIEQIYKQAQGLRRSPISALFLAGYTELAKLINDENPRARDTGLENVKRALLKAQAEETDKLEQAVPFLATTGSAAPFIGLFGTVWGIMASFREIGATRQAGIDVVAPGIAEALIATAIGLLAAIPAVMAFNYFQRRTRVVLSQMETFEQDFLNIIQRHFLK